MQGADTDPCVPIASLEAHRLFSFPRDLVDDALHDEVPLAWALLSAASGLDSEDSKIAALARMKVGFGAVALPQRRGADTTLSKISAVLSVALPFTSVRLT